MEGQSERREWMAEIAGLDGELAGAIRQWAGVERMFTEAAISQTRFEELHAPLESKVRGLESKLVGLRKKLAAVAAEPAEKSWQSLWLSWPDARRRRIILTFVSAFVVSADEVEITYLLPEPFSSKETTELQQITSPTNQTQPAGGPVYVRLPKAGEKCPISGLSRAKLNELIFPNERNSFRPPVARKSLRRADTPGFENKGT